MLKETCDSIAQKLKELAVPTSNGFYWKTLQSGPEGKTEPGYNESIYHGVSGIAYFLFEYAKVTGQKQYGTLAADAMKALVKHLVGSDDHFSPAFYTGRVGTLYTLLKGRENGFLNQADDLVDELLPSLEKLSPDSLVVDDLINGNCGIVLGLLKCYEIYPNSKFIELTERILPQLFNKAYFSKKGIYWDRSRDIINGLCGLSHGAAGFAFVFSELFRVTKNPVYQKMALAAMEYERQHFVSDWQNWQDLRKSYMLPRDVERNIGKLKEGDTQFFTLGADMNAWCHGAAGIGLQRIYNYSLISDYPYLKEEIDAALNKTIETDVKPSEREMQILCHGGAGNAMIFIAQYQQSGEPKYRELAVSVLESEIKEAKQRGNFRCGYGVPATVTDQSLFMGETGIAWAILRTQYPDQIEDILCPVLKNETMLNSNLIREFSASQAFNLMLEKYKLDAAPKLQEAYTFNLEYLERNLEANDYQKVAFDACQESFALNHAHMLLQNKEPIDSIEGISIKLPSYVRFYVKDEEGKLQVSEGQGIRFMDLPDLAAAILDNLAHDGYQLPATVFGKIFEEYEIEGGEAKEVEIALEGQLKEMINAGMVSYKSN
ncbi:lanthionine synthetase LanC family protein [Luteibaculum oceani]|uniref:Lanthionine synthetase C family protein n=1 Tax=Luteibaculum oceani TaxID=1294296 RepID=A0A5C6VJS6_9FLAO|nr:lanthionine synthetase LanC family protein [Luteibaculum oceani]TXC85230.1 hypothetical protein FRX97_00995 [Luteibaculum oceani]